MKWIKKVATTPLEVIAKVVDTLQAQTNDRTNAPSIRAVREAINENWLTIYPIGSIYMCVNDINPSEVFGGTWVKIEDRFLLAAGETYNNGAIGGSATHTLSGTTNGHTLSGDEIPSHVHTYIDNHPQVVTVQSPMVGALESGSYMDVYANPITENTNATGGGQAHSHDFTTDMGDTMPPYLAVNMWKRTA